MDGRPYIYSTHLLGGPAVPGAARSRQHRGAAEGNPLFVEEWWAMLVERGPARGPR